MRSITTSNVSQSRLERFADRPQRGVSSRTSHTFDGQLSSALNPAGTTRQSSGSTVARRQTVAASGSSRQNSGTSGSAQLQNDASRPSTASAESTSTAVSNPAASKAAPPSWENRNTPFGYSYLPGTAPASVTQAAAARQEIQTTAAISAATQAATTPATPMDVLKEALRKANIEPSGLNLYYEEVPVSYPGGSYVNRQFTLELSNGAKESYDAALMLKNPWLTAFEIGRFMSHAS